MNKKQHKNKVLGPFPLSTTYRNGNLSDNLLRNWFFQSLEQPIEAGGHEFHKDPHLRLHNVVTVALDNVGKVKTLSQQLEIIDNVSIIVLITTATHLLHRQLSVGALVVHLLHLTKGATAKFANLSKVFLLDVLVLLQGGGQNVSQNLG